MNENVVVEQKATVRAQGGKYLTFVLDAETYGLEILKIQEIIGMMKITRVPGVPDFVRGVVNLRGKVIPVIDTRIKFGLKAKEDTERTCVIVLQIRRAGQMAIMGMIVDEVSEVLDIPENNIEAPPAFGGNVDTGFLMGMGKIDEAVVMLLDVDRVLSYEELQAVGRIQSEG